MAVSNIVFTVAPPSTAHKPRTRATPGLAPAVRQIGRVRHGTHLQPRTGTRGPEHPEYEGDIVLRLLCLPCS